MAFKPIDPKRDELRRYLERGGVIESLTKVFVRIVRERPKDPIDFLRKNLGTAMQQADEVAYLQNELDEARNEIKRLSDIIKSINPEALVESQQNQQQQQQQIEITQKEEAMSNGNDEQVSTDIKPIDVTLLTPATEDAVKTLTDAIDNCHLQELDSNVVPKIEKSQE